MADGLAFEDVGVRSETGGKCVGQQQLHKRIIAHFDMDCFYAQVEMVQNTRLRELPLGIQQKNIIVTCNYPARARGVRKLQRLTAAFEACPDLVIRDGSNLTRYREASENILDYFKGFTPLVERLGLDEFFLDITNQVNHSSGSSEFEQQISLSEDEGFSPHLYRGLKLTLTETQTGRKSHVPARTKEVEHCRCGCYEKLQTASHLAQKIRTELFRKLGYTASAGISTSKLMAKLCGEVHKPNQQTTMLPAYTPDFLSALRVRKLPGCGYASSKKLHDLGIIYVTELRELSKQKLISVLGESIGSRLYMICRGQDDSEVRPREKEKTMSEEDSFLGSNNVVDVESRISRLLLGLIKRIDRRFQKHGELPSLLRLTIRDRVAAKKNEQKSGYFGGRSSKQTGVQISLFHPEETKREEKAIEILMQLFFKLVPRSLHFHLTLLNVAVGRFQPFGGAYGKQTGIKSFFYRDEGEKCKKPDYKRSSEGHHEITKRKASSETLVYFAHKRGRAELRINEEGTMTRPVAAKEDSDKHLSVYSDEKGKVEGGDFPASFGHGDNEETPVTAKDIDDLFDL
eukprot:CAMPEP_0184496988 /NCGR_PEP_ID=MMETSP0113_2-20130426/35416_1 /TAXON_ID=91329 /ORGANISM="Norrisiella sphaerica, Strain BC52" /LENGTH=571 /DNA_ID=CAMNT_0026883899 /DNA_START=153 /DNA_END=1868 /DNA_ORIENTATION=-